jgi:hypothetical protein
MHDRDRFSFKQGHLLVVWHASHWYCAYPSHKLSMQISITSKTMLWFESLLSSMDLQKLYSLLLILLYLVKRIRNKCTDCSKANLKNNCMFIIINRKLLCCVVNLFLWGPWKRMSEHFWGLSLSKHSHGKFTALEM